MIVTRHKESLAFAAGSAVLFMFGLPYVAYTVLLLAYVLRWR